MSGDRQCGVLDGDNRKSRHRLKARAPPRSGQPLDPQSVHILRWPMVHGRLPRHRSPPSRNLADDLVIAYLEQSLNDSDLGLRFDSFADLELIDTDRLGLELTRLRSGISCDM
ncbi:uncharacterized protein A4U43_C05F6300 [Asparagus officinalis]|uniref:Uncharacterized protein n=1 Tax=Asparagus officinalis TaxID=4686 RepID=A0A5P1EPR9_ASPOF|nr:uncharacterized protein A4U43_C05F6300 [Asparagus officinalis]